MGVSTDGILVFGVDIGEDQEGMPWTSQLEEETDDEVEDPEETEGEDFEGFVYQLAGVPSMASLWEEYYAWEKQWKTGDYVHDSEALDTYHRLNPEWDRKLSEIYALRHKALEECPVELIYHCSLDYPMYILGLKGHVHRARRGYPEVVESLEVDPVMLARAQEYCKMAKIPFESPRWLLASLWG